MKIPIIGNDLQKVYKSMVESRKETVYEGLKTDQYKGYPIYNTIKNLRTIFN